MQNNSIRTAARFVLGLAAMLVVSAAAAKDGMDDPSATEISGVVQSIPAGGLIGDWKIAGKAVTTDAATRFDQEHGKVGVGAMVEVKGAAQGGECALRAVVAFTHPAPCTDRRGNLT